MELFLCIMYFLNILWAVWIDFSVSSYWNAGCGLILALTVPLPSSIGQGTPGIKLHGDRKSAEVSVLDSHWLWISIYTSWDFLLAHMLTLEIFPTASHLLPCYFCCLIRGQWDLYPMVRVTNLWSFFLYIPWSWPELLFGEPFYIKDEMVPIVWGSINLFLAVIWLIYYLAFLWRKRIGQTATKEESAMKEIQRGTVESGSVTV